MKQPRAFFSRFFSQEDGSAEIAKQRLALLLERERVLISAAAEPAAPSLREPYEPFVVGCPFPPPESLTRAESLTLTRVPPPPPAIPAAPPRMPRPRASSREPVLLIRRSVHAGQTISYAGTVVILGDVKSAAEVVADGDVIVFGKLYGVVRAGASGNATSIVAALVFAPTQVSICGQLSSVPRGVWKEPWPEIARADAGQIVIEPWLPPTEF